MGTILQVPYKSQVSSTAGYSHNDCGPACIAMILAAAGHDYTIDSLYKHPSIAGQKGGISFTSLQTLSKAYGVTLKFNRLDMDGLRQNIDGGKPMMILLDYKPIVDNGLNGIATKGVFGHFALVVGYEDNAVVMHDPYFKEDKGAFVRWPLTVMEKAWRGGPGSWGNNYNGQSIYPNDPLAEPLAPEAPPFPMDEGLRRRIRAKALFEKDPIPVISTQDQLNQAIAWLGDWGLYAEAYYIAPGDTLGKISQTRFGTSEFGSALAAYNGIANPNRVEVGTKILIPISMADPRTQQPQTPASTPATPATPGITPVPSGGTRPSLTNQQVINAFYQVYKARGGDADDYWQAMVDAGLEAVANNRKAVYTGPDIRTVPNLPADVRAAVVQKLGL